MNKALFLIVFLGAFILISCNRTSTSRLINDDALPFSIQCKTFQHKFGEGIDSQIGTVVCDDIVLDYDYSRYSSDKPTTQYESFLKSFYAYHYSKFFDAIIIDEKVRDVFLSSVVIVKVTDGKRRKKYIVDCPDCNATASIVFNDQEFFYGFVKSPKIEESLSDYTVTLKGTDQEYYKKTYMNVASGDSGVYLAATGNPTKNRKKNRLSVKTKAKSNDKLLKILDSIQLK